ncbi:GIY-YIG nuclease family protein [Sporolactobacillus spathodeae]|uniref:Endonuclease n=1 Tax=Sporolactobacillus spathodeae TaxID=1465502 RepID=A0ABS2QCC6_9BACL|nr:GIY-YIG nuclease family protein [Sporolactobacillus spathodeae]MBM7658809.1 putative endonuclease [Sporolactobacillus spathodeae]
MKSFSVYILECADGSYYTGYAADVEARFARHVRGKGAKYTRSHRPLRIVYKETLEDKSAAMHREWLIKQMTRKQKEQLIQGDDRNLGTEKLSGNE